MDETEPNCKIMTLEYRPIRFPFFARPLVDAYQEGGEAIEQLMGVLIGRWPWPGGPFRHPMI